ncbi:retron system putative HNH endonuclease [Rhodococcus sp. NPDC060090]|uniref:retron system putative HNH endonuclease n=1 Tax=Rhodococcus sp. NPDC060090 TaxID=3347056 RepID=UPI00365AA046
MTWNQFRGACREGVRNALEAMNTDLGGPLCSYCESEVNDNTGWHIEHLHRKHDFPERTFDWSNLFLCCQNTEHCGHFKDAGGGAYRPSDLIHPDKDDPDEYLQFYSSGEVKACSGLSADQRIRAESTIRVLNLNHSSLKGRRSAVARRARDLVLMDLDFLDSLAEEERIELLSEEIRSFRSSAHPTVARHFFTSLD